MVKKKGKSPKVVPSSDVFQAPIVDLTMDPDEMDIVNCKDVEEQISELSLASKYCSDIGGKIAELRNKLISNPSSPETLIKSLEDVSLLSPALEGLLCNEDYLTVITLLSKFVWSYQCARRVAENYCIRQGSPLSKLKVMSDNGLSFGEPSSKKLKTATVVKWGEGTMSKDELKNFLEALFLILKQLPNHVYSSWDVKPLLMLNTSDTSKDIRWIALQCASLLLDMSETEYLQVLKSWGLEMQENFSFSLEMQRKIELMQNNFKIDLDSCPTLYQGLQHLDETSQLVNVDGIIVRQKCRVEPLACAEIVLFPSFLKRLKDITLHIMNNSPVCVTGPIGSGKSATLKQVASIFGRTCFPDFINVQMNDQIDSRVILGSYHSTDLPGHFVWKPGCLTKAVLNGHWIVFEDIDAAPMDVITLLDGFVGTGTLSVPGYGDIDRIHPDFRLFATCRSQNSGSTSHRKIGKLWKTVFANNYTTEELKLIVHERFPQLHRIADVLINIYNSLVASASNKSIGNFRSISIRDFLKFCNRIPAEMDFTSSASAISIFQDGLDLFVASLPSPGLKDATAEIIGTYLNLLKAKSEYFLTMYAPSVVVCPRTNAFICGRFSLNPERPSLSSFGRDQSEVYSLTRRTSNTLEAIAGFVKHKEPVLLVGETGVGKTSCVQHLAKVLNRKLVVVNLNRQSDSVDLLGGYKPVELKYIFLPLREEFEWLFGETFSKDSNAKYLNHIMTCYANKRWKDLVKLMIHVKNSVFARSDKFSEDILQRWVSLYRKLSRVEFQLSDGEESPFAFSFIDGTLIKAIKNGYWILLDEINLATSEMLQCLAGVLDDKAQIHLWEKGDDEPVKRHENFHLFAAMNPSTDVGKKELPVGIRNRFSELYVGEIYDTDELRVLVSDYLKEMCLSSSQINNIVQFYSKVRAMAQTSLVDGLGKHPHYSLRTLCRALKIASLNIFGSILRSLYESFCLSFLTQLDFDSHPIVEQLVAEHIFGKSNVKPILNQPIPCPSNSNCVKIEGYWIPKGDMEPKAPENYILTSSIRRNLKDIARIVSAGKLPVLIQGATSVGKTSLIQYLSQCSGNRCYRINNHQHTDLQEYIGSYQSDKNGKLVFAEGVLVQAMRKGEWIILDELNLAPSEVLEALNRLLDDNRQLFITETGLTVTAHPRFMLFATQNPPGLYGGRKVLSRAFRNRFVELHFDEIPALELENILHLRCAIPESYCKKIIGVMKDLQLRRKSSAALQGKHGFATLRDLFRWAERYRLSGTQKTKFYDWDQHIADEGYLVLAGKERKNTESDVIREVLEKRFKRKVDPQNLFALHEKTSNVTRDILELVLKSNILEFKHIVWTSQMRRLVVLIGSAMKFKEPILLVGETGCGKTSITQLLAQLMERKLYCVNCHMNSEGSDFLGGLRPIRDHSKHDDRLFEWVDGPLVEAMANGGIFLADEISLADDSVLERLNSVLEPERTLLISEKGDQVPMVVVADDNFHFIGTMNPGGDYGKKELSPALRNRLTEIWCDSTTNDEDLISIVQHNVIEELKHKNIGYILVKFVKWLQNHDLGQKCIVSIRDYLAWVNFINHMMTSSTPRVGISLMDVIIHGACMAFLDGLGTGNTGGESTVFAQELKNSALEFLKKLIAEEIKETEMSEIEDSSFKTNQNHISVGPFIVSVNPFKKSNDDEALMPFSLDAPTTSTNAMRLLRAMQLSKPILLEGCPGVGKTALVSALAKITGFPLTRINLSEQTDISDLFGADLPVEGKEGGHFEWRDGPLLQALKTQSWILLDELNLASQSVLEGLNACLDHRGSVYVPELNRTFQITTSENTSVRSRIFACQNPVRQGGARKGLPKSFLNRFIQVYVDSLSSEDFNFVLQKSHPLLPLQVAQLMSTFASQLQLNLCQQGLFGFKGSPWDINLRDLMRWAELTVGKKDLKDSFFTYSPENYVDLIYGLRMRTSQDRRKILELYTKTHCDFFPNSPIKIDSLYWGNNDVIVRDDQLYAGPSHLKRMGQSRFSKDKLIVLQKDMAQLGAVITCLNSGWMPIVVGSSSCGKTSLVKLVSELSGKKLEVVHPSPEMDTIELLGGFEQADVYRRVYDVRKHLEEILQQFVKRLVMTNRIEDELMDVWSSLKNSPNLSPEEGLAQDEEVKRIQDRVDFLQTAYLKCKSFSESESCNPKMPPYENKGDSLAFVETGFQRPKEKLQRISKELEQIYTHLKAGIQTGAFQWIDSRLLRAMENGEWLLVDGANRCSAAVLDRLNSLMEPNGSIFLSERGSIDGNILEIKPHPDFRLILTVDPAYGEISRAMRNRGVEIYMGTEEDLEELETNEMENVTTVGKMLNWENSAIIQMPRFGISFFDLDNLLRAEGLRDLWMRQGIMNIHNKLLDAFPSTIDSAEGPLFKVICSTKEIILQLQQGVSFVEACKRSLHNCYLGGNRNEKIDEILSKLPTILKFPNADTPLIPLALQNFVDSGLYRLWKHLEVLDNGMGQLSLIVDKKYGSLDKELLEDFLILSIFSRVIKQDAGALSIALGLRYPLKASFVNKLATVLEESWESGSFADWKQQFWDVQEIQHVIAKFCGVNEGGRSNHLLKTLKISLQMFYKTKLFHQNLLPTQRKGTLGFVLKNLKFADAGPLFEFLQSFWILASQYNSVYESCLAENIPQSFPDFENLGCQNVATKWINGIKSALWKKRLDDLCSQTCLSNLPDEKLMANMNLVIQWISEQVLPSVQNLGSISAHEKMQTLVRNCFKTLGHCRDRVLLQRNKMLRDVCSSRSLTGSENLEATQELMQILFLVWLNEDSIPKNSIIKFFTSEESQKVHGEICQALHFILNGKPLDFDDKNNLKQIRENFNLMQKSNNDDNELSLADPSSVTILALEEFLHLKQQVTIGSSFANPLLTSCQLENITGNSIIQFLKWEESDRFRSLFIDAPLANIQSSHLLPVFASRLLVDQEKKTFKAPSLESNGILRKCQRKLLNILSSESTTSTQNYNFSFVTKKLVDNFTKVLVHWHKVLSAESSFLIPFESWIDRLRNLSEKETCSWKDKALTMIKIGIVIIEAASFILEVSSYLPAVDPVVEKEVSAIYLDEQVNIFKTWIQSKRVHQLVVNGRDLINEDCDSSLIHPYTKYIIEEIINDTKSLKEANSGIIPRPTPPMYTSIVQDIQQFVGTFASSSKIKELTDTIENIFNSETQPSQEFIQSVVVQCENWIDCQRNFVHKTFKKFWYWDISAPFLEASAHAATGYQLICDNVKRYFAHRDPQIVSLIKFPQPYIEEQLLTRGNNVFEDDWAIRTANKKAFLSSMMSFGNKLKIQKLLKKDDVLRLHKYCTEFTNWWNAQEEDQRRKKEEQDAFYIFKGKEKSIEKSDEEQELFDIVNTFPSFENDFTDLREARCLEDEGHHKYEPKNDIESSNCGELKLEDVETFLKVIDHAVSLVENGWLSKRPAVSKENSMVDFITPFMNRFEIGCHALADGNCIDKIDYEEEREFIVGATVGNHRLNINCENSQWDPTTYNFYYDPNISEAQKLQSLFSGLKIRITELLLEWPDHPALQQIIKIIYRIESFTIDSPIMKFLTGLELLLGTCQEWQAVAAKRVSISQHLEELTGLIISWRKLELRFWKNMLHHTFKQQQREANAWWFHIFSVTMELINNKSPEETKDTLLNLLQKFVETASIGEFETRILILQSFQRYLTLLETHKMVKLHPCIQPYFWNTIRYYSAFKDQIATKLNSLRDPIEKKLKEFMKISRWNDSNFYALVESVKKSQKTLNKLIVEYKNALKSPVSTVLIADIEASDVKKMKYKISNPEPSLYILPEISASFLVPSDNLIENFSLSQIKRKRYTKMPKLYEKSRKISANVIARDLPKNQNETTELSDFTGAIIEKVHELQNQNFPDSGPQRKKALHNIHNLRRKNLAELFKSLQGLGLSYKKGMIKMENFPIDTKVPFDFLINPMDVSAGWSHLLKQTNNRTRRTHLLKAWDNCEEYFQKCIARVSSMMKSFQSPSKELGLMIIERCKGFGVELFTTVCDQKIVLEKFNSSLWNLTVLLDIDAMDSRTTIINEQWKNNFYQKICRLEYEMSQYESIFEALVDSPTIKPAILLEVTKIINQKIASIKSKLYEFMNILISPLQIHIPINADCLTNIDGILTEVCSKFNDLKALLAPGSIIAEKLFVVHQFAKECHQDLQNFVAGTTDSDDCQLTTKTLITQKFKNSAAKVLEDVLLAFQDLEKFDDSTCSSAINDNLCYAKLKGLNAEFVCLEYLKMQNIISKRIFKEDCSTMIDIFNSLKPIVKQFAVVSEFYLKSALEHHRESCKLLYVLLGIFGTLAQKGFCLPSDYEDEAVEEGAELDAKSGMGLGEGETTSDAKDVSDRIESEDQLEDTLKAGESVDPADKDLNDDQKGVEMSEDFEGKQQEKQQGKEKDDQENDDDSESEQGDDLDKQMGDVDGENEDVLDDKMWGGSSDEDDDNEENEESSEGKGVQQNQEPELAPKDSNVDTSEPKPNEKQKQENPKDYNEMDEGEVNDDQVDPYHGQNAPEEEPDAMDLPEDLKLDGDNDDEEGGGEPESNPFDLDNKEIEDFQDVEMKEDDEKKLNDEEGQKEISDNEDDQGEDMNIDAPQVEENVDDAASVEQIEKQQNGMEIDENVEEEEDKSKVEDDDNAFEKENKQDQENTEPTTEESKNDDQSNANTMKKDTFANDDNESQNMMQSVEEEQKGDNNEKSSGQVNTENGDGQEGQSINKEKAELSKSDNDDKNASRKPGETDSDRSISTELTKSRLKTVKDQERNNPEQDEGCENDETAEKEADLYQHIKQSDKHDALTIDNATSEQMNEQKHKDPKEDSKEIPEMDEEMEDDSLKDESDVEDLDETKLDNNQPDLIKGLPQDKKRKKKKTPADDQEEEETFETPGLKVPTYGVQRPPESTIHTQSNLLEEKSTMPHKNEADNSNIIQKEKIVGDLTLISEWHELERKTIPLSQDLCEKLRLILEPTQASKLKGDYKTGKRLNMRKVIPYIASGFRKDKIWLRRTQPSKREYQILLALDDSASMCDNQSKQMAFSAVAVVAKALSLLEVGQLAIASFGEDVQLLHSFEEPFTDFSGARLLQRFSFSQRKTRIVQLMETTTALFNHAKQSFGNSSAPIETAQLLLIVSDGRAVCHEGSEIVRNAVKKATEQNVFIVFVIVDNPENQHSILDIQKPIFKDGKVERFAKYMDDFPFPFYLILRDLSALPSVLSDALMQWFELVTSSSR